MKLRTVFILLSLAGIASIAAAQPPSLQAGGAAAQGEVKIPHNWFTKASGYEKALELQKQTGADLFVYFSRMTEKDEKGLCKWFETKALRTGTIDKYLKDYIKVEMPLPSNNDTEAIAKEFGVGKTPAVYIVQPNGFRQKCRVFDWPDGRPELYSNEELIEAFRVRSSARYQLPAPTNEPSSAGSSPGGASTEPAAIEILK